MSKNCSFLHSSYLLRIKKAPNSKEFNAFIFFMKFSFFLQAP